MVWKGQQPLKKLWKLTFTFEERFGSWNSACGIIRMIIVPIISLFFSSHVYKRLNNSPAMWPMLRIFPKAEEMYTFFTVRIFCLFLRSHIFILHVHTFYLNCHIPWKMILFIKLQNKPAVLFKFQLQHCTALIFSSCESRWLPQN